MKIIGFAGTKQSGKNSACNFVVGHCLVHNDKLDHYYMNEDGNLLVPTDTPDKYGILDLNRRDPEFFEQASNHIWPYAKVYAIADKLKAFVSDVFNIDINLLYGTNEDKNTPTTVKWEKLYKFLDKSTVKELKAVNTSEFVSIRDLLKYFGSNICRELNNDCWINSCLKQIEFEDSEVAVICDVRFPNEIEAIKNKGGVVILLERDPFNDEHPSEQLIREMDRSVFSAVIDNKDLDIEGKNAKLLEVIKGLGLFNVTIGT
jgi:hypothetical protein